MNPQRRVILLKLVPSKPKCFDSYQQWTEYVMTAAEASHSDDPRMAPFTKDGYGLPQWNGQFNYCGDCSAQFRAQMAGANRCAKEARRSDERRAGRMVPVRRMNDLVAV